MSRARVTCDPKHSGMVVLSLPLLSFSFCVIYSLVMNFEETTETHCKVANLLPSLSAAIGNFAPQTYVWRAGIGLHSAPRYAYAWMYWHQYRSFLPAKYQYLAHAVFLLEIIELSSLVGLSMVSSSENYPMHEKFFLTFLFVSIFHQLLSSICLPKFQTRHGPHHRKSLMLKRKCFYLTLICTVICAITFHRHNTHCEPYMYTGFALSEYVIVFANIVFHSTAFYDFDGATLIVALKEDDTTHLLKPAVLSD